MDDAVVPSLEFFTDLAAFMAVAGDHLGASPAITSVVATTAVRSIARGEPQLPEGQWMVVVRSGADVVGLAMSTAPFDPRPLYVCPMPEAAAVEIARALHARGERPGGANGALPAARILAEESARLWSGEVEQAMASRLWELGDLVVPDGVPGTGRLATYADLEVCLDWFNDFGRAAREQAGNAEEAQGPEHHDADEIRLRIDEGRILLWEHDGEVVHLTGFNAPAFGVSRVGPVYTPTEHRGHGYASAAVAEVSRRLLADGARVCLFTDLDNPVSNHVYAKIGFRPVADMANHTVSVRRSVSPR